MNLTELVNSEGATTLQLTMYSNKLEEKFILNVVLKIEFNSDKSLTGEVRQCDTSSS